MPTFTRKQARMIAEELYSLIGKDCKAAAGQVAELENEEYLTVKETAAMLKWAESTVYKRKQEIGAYTKVGRQLRFSKTRIRKIVETGRLSTAERSPA